MPAGSYQSELSSVGVSRTARRGEYMRRSTLIVGDHSLYPGATTPTKCPEGTYQDELGQTTCKDCDQGYYCP